MLDRSRQRGPVIYEIVRAVECGALPQEMFEFPIYGDAHIVGETNELPCSLLNNVSMPSGPGDFRPIIVVRARIPAMQWKPEPIEATDTSRYHGGHFQDEVAALIALHLGIRTKAGAIDRTFASLDDPGRPRGWDAEGWPARQHVKLPPRLPFAYGEHHLQSDMFSILAKLTPEQSSALMKAARSYQRGMWIGELEPEQAWLHFVAAIEAVSSFVEDTQSTDADLLLEYYPEIARPILEDGSRELLNKVAPMLRRLYGSTRRFIEFMLKYLPAAPPIRPTYGQLPWTSAGLRPILQTVYKHRSRALHDGTPFPYPMCERPPKADINENAPMEHPPFLGASGMQGKWLLKDTPTYLHVFAYLVQGTLLNWWKSIAA